MGQQISFDGAESRTYSFSARVDPVVGGTVSCKFTVDNEVRKVYYNNQDITGQVSGNLGDWGPQKQFSFQEMSGAVLWITGYNWEAGSCGTGGMSIVCTSTNTASTYHNMKSDSNRWKAKGFGSNPDTAMLTNTFDVSSWTNAPCISTSGYSLSGVDPQPPKLWASTGENYAAFQFSPVVVAGESVVRFGFAMLFLYLW